MAECKASMMERRAQSRGYRALVFLFASIAFSAFPVATHAESFEARTYLDIGANRSPSPDLVPDFRLGPFVREESRFGEDGLTYVKASAGARMTLLPWLRTALSYAHMDFPKTSRRPAEMGVFDAFLSFHVGTLATVDKNGLELHVTDAFIRYRNALEFRWESPLHWLAPFAKGEFRVDLDAARVNMLDTWVGLLLKLLKPERSMLSLRLFYGYETGRRGKSSWKGGHFMGIALTATL